MNEYPSKKKDMLSDEKKILWHMVLCRFIHSYFDSDSRLRFSGFSSENELLQFIAGFSFSSFSPPFFLILPPSASVFRPWLMFYSALVYYIFWASTTAGEMGDGLRLERGNSLNLLLSIRKRFALSNVINGEKLGLFSLFSFSI